MTAMEQSFLLRTEFFQILKTVGAPQRILTLKQVLSYLQDYITSRQLTNPQDRHEYRVGEDPLGGVFGTQTFTVHDVIKLLSMQMFRIVPQPVEKENNPVTGFTQLADATGDGASQVPFGGEKRKFNECSESPVAGVSDDTKRPRQTEPMYLQIPPSPILLSGDETEFSIQGYETEYCKNSTDDLWFLESDRESSGDDFFEVEYEVESAASDTTNATDTDSDIEDVMCVATLFPCKDDSDVPFWGDKSDDEEEDVSSDPELEEADKWSCSKCESQNKATNRFCLKCWDQRVGWLGNRNERPKRRSKKLNRNLSDPGYQSSQSTAIASQDEGALGSQETLCPSQENGSTSLASQAAEMCPMCLVRAKTGLIIHGKTSHQMCCYKCARRLQSSKKRCPQCRKSIQRVARNYIV